MEPPSSEGRETGALGLCNVALPARAISYCLSRWHFLLQIRTSCFCAEAFLAGNVYLEDVTSKSSNTTEEARILILSLTSWLALCVVCLTCPYVIPAQTMSCTHMKNNDFSEILEKKKYL